MPDSPLAHPRTPPTEDPVRAVLADAHAARLGRGAFDEAVRRDLPRLLGTAWRLTGDGHVAEEVVAEALFRAWRKRGAFRGDARLGTWLHRIVCRTAVDRHRAEARRRRHEADAAEAMSLRREPPTWLLPSMQDELGRAAAWTAALPERQREVVLLHAWEGLSLQDVAATLRMRYATVKSHLHHARRALGAARDAHEDVT
ncbi:MAG: RNA polymerase sigma factor [Planctomycetota bacterium]